MAPISQTVTITVVMTNQHIFDKIKKFRSQLLAMYNAIYVIPLCFSGLKMTNVGRNMLP
jgi:hypothetical protein